ncbi:hypothetical protein [Actinobaculum sp. 352]|uniref:hypothetical protein n=1 Tax=Actinobaculum sp. 352 TaxID=2490946 RepID=UPI000F7E2944|nr:hypothetical protein [Actinobaculum sp. 352]RTE47915.1 hypothetical protein EKN07_11690 [Actinobaculum sp. 352]
MTKTNATLRVRYPIVDYDAIVADLREEAIERTIAIARDRNLAIVSRPGRSTATVTHEPGRHIDVMLHVTVPGNLTGPSPITERRY